MARGVKKKKGTHSADHPVSTLQKGGEDSKPNCSLCDAKGSDGQYSVSTLEYSYS
jgi:hypothetical protein